jgi:hypothetical protein
MNRNGENVGETMLCCVSRRKYMVLGNSSCCVVCLDGNTLCWVTLPLLLCVSTEIHGRVDGTTHGISESLNGSTAVSINNFEHLVIYQCRSKHVVHCTEVLK